MKEILTLVLLALLSLSFLAEAANRKAHRQGRALWIYLSPYRYAL